MYVGGIYRTIYVFVTVHHLMAAQAAAPNVRDNLIKMVGKNEQVPPGGKDNPFLQEFLDIHSRPKVVLETREHSMFNLKMDESFEFKPPIRKAPFSSTGEPWPMPAKYVSNKDKLLQLNTASFKLKILNKNCDILEDAIKRYTNLISSHVPEEHYEFIYNFDEKTRAFREHEMQDKYQHVTEMGDLEIHVENEECRYPHVQMDESYKLVVKEGVCKLSADRVWGALRGLETFSQLLFRKFNTSQVYAKETEIEDKPRFPHRGILIDTSRHYIHKHVIRDVLDGMAYTKLNVLHWHMVDDNSFPYQSEVYPKLSEKGAYHPTLIYSLKDIRELVEYARLRGIRVVPEFDSPGHSFSWFGYPEIKSTCYTRNGKAVRGPIGPINPAKNETYEFMSNLFNEIFDVFPDEFVHLGGDELHDSCWATNPTITAYLEEFGNIPQVEARTSNVQNYINKAIGFYFSRLIKTLKDTAEQKQQRKNFIMWEDVLRNTEKVPSESILQVWMGQPSNVRVLNSKGYKALYSSCWYLDNIEQYPMWSKYYECDPSPYSSDAEEKGRLLGGEACLWAEFITTDTLMTMMWPRSLAPAERLWSPRNVRDIGSAARRIEEQRCRMINRGLATGHISGPDYCIRPNGEYLRKTSEHTAENKVPGVLDRVLNVGQALDLGAEYSLNDSPSEKGGRVPLVVFTNYYNYLPFVNIVLSLTGIYLLLMASKCFRQRRNNL
ncbi:beta-hexosaminidase subunit beta-like isoform X2 [Mya arenaria]|nr:beta-hexosaminidase subunit beta-like isoform X2 [Mya arenaria]XP_052815811.1 beta-hexosaminidase subunit beta-like isoform X2 [Mya arenaria]XP_052815812.1 beta-hexosaminidase subunit beta-like isoform X2 [Mya arenaria]